MYPKTFRFDTGLINSNDFPDFKEEPTLLYHTEYIANLRRDLLEGTGLYELDGLLNPPMCMVRGSLADALELANHESPRGATIMEYLQNQARFGVAERIKAEHDEKLFMESAQRHAKE